MALTYSLVRAAAEILLPAEISKLVQVLEKLERHKLMATLLVDSSPLDDGSPDKQSFVVESVLDHCSDHFGTLLSCPDVAAAAAVVAVVAVGAALSSALRKHESKCLLLVSLC